VVDGDVDNINPLKVGKRNWLTSSAVEDGIRCIFEQLGSNSAIGWSPQGLVEKIGRGELDVAVNLAAKQHLLDRDIILQPLNTEHVGPGKHWVLGVISMNDRIIFLLDSWLKNRKNVAASARAFQTLFTIVSVIVAGGGVRTYAKDWTFLIADDMPCQKNGYDCAVYVLMAADAVVNKRQLTSIPKTRGRAWVRRLLLNATNLGDVDSYNRNVNIPANVLRRYVASLASQRLPIPAHAEIGDMIPVILTHLENNWTICDAEDDCKTDSSHDLPQNMCVACRRWLHPTCETLQKFPDPTYPSYLYCQHCFPG
jgi:hypothetical protein